MENNKQIDLNNHLFRQLERLSDPETTGDKLLEEITRAKAVTSVAMHLVNNGRLALDAQKHRSEFLRPGAKMPSMLEDPNHEPRD